MKRCERCPWAADGPRFAPICSRWRCSARSRQVSESFFFAPDTSGGRCESADTRTRRPASDAARPQLHLLDIHRAVPMGIVLLLVAYGVCDISSVGACFGESEHLRRV